MLTYRGLEHEHQRPDRESTVHYACENLHPRCDNMPIDKTCCDEVPSECCRNKLWFQIMDGPGRGWSGSYDIGSIMHYQGWGFGLRGKDTLIPVPPNTWPEFGVEPSELDVERICKIQSDEYSIGMKLWKEKRARSFMGAPSED